MSFYNFRRPVEERAKELGGEITTVINGEGEVVNHIMVNNETIETWTRVSGEGSGSCWSVDRRPQFSAQRTQAMAEKAGRDFE